MEQISRNKNERTDATGNISIDYDLLSPEEFMSIYEPEGLECRLEES